MKVLSLFDGISCGRVALERAEIPVDSYVAYEIEENVIKISNKNYPDIVHKGSVIGADFTQYSDYDLLIGGSPCFTEGHLVLTKDGYKDISKIQIGDSVLTHTGEYHKVIRTNTRSAETKILDIKGYAKFITTENHPFYTIVREKASEKEYKENNSWRKFTSPKWTKVKDLTNNHFCGQRIHRSSNDNCLSLEDCWLLGRYIADGHVRKSKRKNRKNSYIYQFIISVGDYKLDYFKSKINNRKYSCYPHSQSTHRCVFSSMELVNFVIDNNFGRSAATKRIPEFIFNMDYEHRKEFLMGYLSGDGYHKGEKWNASTVSKELAIGLQRLAISIYKTNVSVRYHEKRQGGSINGRQINSNYGMYLVVIPEREPKQSVGYINDNIVWSQVNSVQDTNLVETVYNIEVETDNSYTVNNCIVHNCQSLSIIQSKTRQNLDGKSKLFFEFVRAKNEMNPKWFLFENVSSMNDESKNVISELLGCEPIFIDSSDFSAQSRPRYYWTNIPVDMNYLKSESVLKDIMQNDVDEKYYYSYPVEDIDMTKQVCAKLIHNNHEMHKRVFNPEFKCHTLTAVCGGNQQKKVMDDGRVRKLTPLEYERLQTLPDNYTQGVSDGARYKAIGNGWTVDVIAYILKGLK